MMCRTSTLEPAASPQGDAHTRITRVTRPRSRGYTLCEVGVTVALLVILLGLSVSLARYVRNRSSQDQLGRLEQVLAQYVLETGVRPSVSPLLPEQGFNSDDAGAELILAREARRNNADFVRAVTGDGTTPPASEAAARRLSDLIIPGRDINSVRDAWGTPIVLMPRQHPLVGMAAGNRAFFVSAGPDRRFLTRDDNLYSYETYVAAPTTP